ncbi:MAG TPA: hypothetical protein VKN73_04890, partial [Desulfosalsimonadaceae bacterium]|nr:hypothetical protein [Desulfosalsimonadaceae bacterium]
SQKAIYAAAEALLQKLTQKDPENPPILSFRAAARNLKDSSSLALLGMTAAEDFGITRNIV